MRGRIKGNELRSLHTLSISSTSPGIYAFEEEHDNRVWGKTRGPHVIYSAAQWTARTLGDKRRFDRPLTRSQRIPKVESKGDR